MNHAIAMPAPAGLSALTDLERVYFGFLAEQNNPRTRAGYERHLKTFFDWCYLHQLQPLQVERTHVAMYVRHLSEERGLRGSTVSSYVGPVKGLFKWAFVEGFIDRDPIVHVKLPRVEYRKKYPLERDELKAFRRAATTLGGRHWALGELLVCHALRITECCDLLIENCQGVERGHRVMTLRRKGGKMATLPMPAVMAMAIDAAAGDRTRGCGDRETQRRPDGTRDRPGPGPHDPAARGHG